MQRIGLPLLGGPILIDVSRHFDRLACEGSARGAKDASGIPKFTERSQLIGQGRGVSGRRRRGGGGSFPKAASLRKVQSQFALAFGSRRKHRNLTAARSWRGDQWHRGP